MMQSAPAALAESRMALVSWMTTPGRERVKLAPQHSRRWVQGTVVAPAASMTCSMMVGASTQSRLVTSVGRVSRQP
jgi:hypothetical protein